MSILSKEKSGTELIKIQVSKFQTIIDGLDKGICMCEDEVARHEKMIKTLAETNKSINESKDMASTFKSNLENMLQKPSEE